MEDSGLIVPFVIVDAAVDVVSPPPGCSAITVTPLLLLESVSELLQQESVLVDLCLELTELLQVQASEFLGGGVHIPCCPKLDERGCGVARPLAGRDRLPALSPSLLAPGIPSPM